MQIEKPSEPVPAQAMELCAKPSEPVPGQAMDCGNEKPSEPVPSQAMELCAEPFQPVQAAMPTQTHVKQEPSAAEQPQPMPANAGGVSHVEAVLRRPNTCDLSNNMTAMGPATRVLVDVGGTLQVATLPMTREQAIEAGMRVVDDLTPVPVAKTTFQPTGTGEETAAAGGANTSGEETDREKPDDEATAAAKQKPSAAMTPEACM